MEKICPVCHKTFYNNHKNVKTCSRKCGSILRFHNKEKKLRKRFIENLEQRHPDISYISGYRTQERNHRKNIIILVRCNKTGIRYYVYDSHLRKKNWQCSICNPGSTHADIFPDDTLKYKMLNQKTELIIFYPCKYCGRSFEQHKGKQFCSDKCKRKWTNRLKEKKRSIRTKRAKNNGEYDTSITLAKLYKRDNGVCYLCGKHLTLTDNYNRPYAPTIDHIIPIAKGGTNTWDNVKLACRNCNVKKGTKIYN